MALAFAVIGIWQYSTRNVFWNPKVIVDNAYATSGWFYRVNSVFWDPSIYGRFLVVAILASLVLVLFGRGTIAWPALGVAVVVWLGSTQAWTGGSLNDGRERTVMRGAVKITVAVSYSARSISDSRGVA